jgi:lysophospholipid acyltransferase (LPLAT)-like uncharacterized protein
VSSIQASKEAGAVPRWKTAVARAMGEPLFAYLDFVEGRTTAAGAPGAAEAMRGLAAAGRSCFVYAWHQDTYLLYLLVRLVPELRELVWLTHDHLRALLHSLPAAARGVPVFVFTLRERSRLDQVVQAFRRPTRLLVFPDSGGPYFRLKAGFIELARRSGMPIVPLAVTMERSFEVGPMRHRIPLPGGTIGWSLGEPLLFDATGGPAALASSVDRAEGALAAARGTLM